MRFAIFGTGGLGGYYGARLAKAGHEVSFVARGAQLEAMRRDGLRVLSKLGDIHLEKPRVSDDPRQLGKADCVIVAVKSWQVAEAAQAMAPLLGSDTTVLPFLNGVEAADQLGAVLAPERVLGGVSKVFSLIEAPGVIRHASPGAYVELGELDGARSARARTLCAAFAAAGIEAVLSGDIRAALWKKLVTVSSWAGLGALARSPMGMLRKYPETRAMIDRAMDEGIAVGAARGHFMSADLKGELWRYYDALPEVATASMQRDVMAGRPSELEAWNGAVVRFGAEAGIETPVHRFTYHALLPMERRARAQG
ncbi:MAG TPA: 2-dehydropantoate 2-reductase [Burkholderiales bacterium]|nr:2-dehydropantoate 2-reductase [Burkholderiales bacterium]